MPALFLAEAATPWAPRNDLFGINYRFAGLAFLLVAVGVAAGLFLTPWFRARRTRLDRQAGTVKRHTAGYILMHWLNAVGFLLCTFTALIMLRWLNIAMAKPLLYTLHFIGAGSILVGMGAVAVHAIARGTSTQHPLVPSGKKVYHACVELLGYAGLVGDRGILGFAWLRWPAALRRAVEKAVKFKGFERAGKYLAAEEVLSYPLWALVGLAVVGSGLLKAVRYVYYIPPSVLHWMTLIHDWALWGVLIMLAVHVGAQVLVRTNWPLLASMFTSRVPAEYVRTVHGEWYDNLEREAAEGAAGLAPVAAARETPSAGD